MPLLVAAILLGLAARDGAVTRSAPDPPHGARVIASTGRAAGAVTRGDVIAGWHVELPASAPPSQQMTGGRVDDPFTLEHVELEYGRHAQVILDVRRGTEVRQVRMPAAPWGLELWPAAAPDGNAGPNDDMGTALEPNRAAARTLVDRGQPRAAAWIHVSVGDRLLQRDEHQQALDEYQTALLLLSKAPAPPATAAVRRRAARSALRLGRVGESQEHLRAASAEEESVAPQSLALAETLAQLAEVVNRSGQPQQALEIARRAQALRAVLAPGTVVEAAGWSSVGELAIAQRDYAAAEEAARRALGILEPMPPSLDLARALETLGQAHQRRGRLDEAAAAYERSLGLRERLAPGSLDHGKAFNNIAIIASMRGDLAAAEAAYDRGAAIVSRVAPRSGDMAALLNNRGILAMLRGRLEEAEQHLARALELKERRGAPPLDRASTMHNLALAAIERLDLDLARSYLEQVRELRGRAAPESPELASTLNLLAGVERRRGRGPAAEAHVREALRIRRAAMPASLETSFSLVELGRILEARGDTSGARTAYEEALAIRERLGGESTSVAEALDLLSGLAAGSGDLATARAHAERALAIWMRRAPGSFNEASAQAAIGRLDRQAGNVPAAIARHRAAVEALDVHTGRLGGSHETQASFRSAAAGFYADYIGLLLDAGQADEAFHVLERSRARAFLAILAERDLAIGHDLPAPLESARRALAGEYDRTQARLASRDAVKDAAEIARLTAQLGDIRARQARLATEIRQASPRVGDLRYPEPVTLPGARAALDNETLVLSYLAGDRELVGFAFSRSSPLRTERIPLGRAALAEHVARYRRVIARGRLEPAALAEAVAAGRELYDLLVRPFEATLRRHQLLLVVPDGPLGEVPFAALVTSRSGTPQFLVESMPVRQVPSLTVLSELAGRQLARSRTGGPTLLAVGDPAFEPASSRAAETPSLSGALDPLPGARQEVEAIRPLFPSRSTVLVGTEATEAALKTHAPEARYLHIATHGLLHARRPLDSGLALARAPDSAENGLLQAWEVLEQLRLDAELVVLSGCDTARGEMHAAEGLIGLTRAFQFAGAGAVLASLWPIGDEAAPALMRRFYDEVQRGRAFDEALATAQRALLAREGLRHPYFWAGFVLDGLRR